MNARSFKTKEAIKKTAKSMIADSKFHDITVSKLTNRLGIHRKTFYLYYKNLYELYSEIINDLSNDLEKYFIKPHCPEDIKTNVTRFFSFANEQDEYFQRILCDSSYKELLFDLASMTEQRNRAIYNPFDTLPIAQQKVISFFIMTTMIDLYRQWVLTGKKLDLDEISEIAATLIYSGVEGFLG